MCLVLNYRIMHFLEFGTNMYIAYPLILVDPERLRKKANLFISKYSDIITCNNRDYNGVPQEDSFLSYAVPGSIYYFIII